MVTVTVWRVFRCHCRQTRAGSRLTRKTTWKNQAKVRDMSKVGTRSDKAGDKAERCGRDSWWLGAMRDTPHPGLYHVPDFIEEAERNPVKKTYGFKGVGREARTLTAGGGDLLLPGAYEHTDFIQQGQKHQASYSFKNCPRPDIVTLGVRDKHLKTSPCDYNVTERPVEKLPCRHVMFRSTVQRIVFPPRGGLAPGHYSPQTRREGGVTSCFRSTVPRLYYVHPKTPGPGAYDPDWKLDVGHRNTEVMDPSFSLYFRNIP